MKNKIVLLMGLLIFLSTPSLAEGKIWAVLVGINDYQNAAPLQCCKTDVTRFKDLLLKMGATKSRILLMTDDAPLKQHQPSFGNMVNVIPRWFQDKTISPDDTFYFYFSGHGIRMGDKDYLMPADASSDGDSIAMTAYPLEKVYNLALKCKAKQVVLILDACRDLVQGKGASKGSQFGADIKRFTTNAKDSTVPKTVVTLQSCAPDEISWEMPSKNQGVFSYYLIQGLESQNKRKLSQLSEYLTEEVSGWARENGKPIPQTPMVSVTSKVWSDIALLPEGVATSTSIPTLDSEEEDIAPAETAPVASALSPTVSTPVVAEGPIQAWVGFNCYNSSIDGIRVLYVNPDSPAAKAGLEKNDIILAFNGQTLKDDDELTKLWTSVKIGESIPVVIKRSSGKITINVDIVREPDQIVLIRACRQADIDTIRHLLDIQPSLLKRLDDSGVSALHAACWTDRIKIIRLLVEEYHADVNVLDSLGMEPLSSAHKREVAEYLIQKGADVNHRDKEGATPLDWLVLNNKLEIVQLLIEQGVDVNACSKDNVSPIYTAASFGKLDMVKILIANGANVNLVTKWGETPLAVAESRNHSEVADYLRSHGATK